MAWGYWKAIVESQGQTVFSENVANGITTAERANWKICFLSILFQYLIEHVTKFQPSIGSLANHEQISLQLSMNVIAAELPQRRGGIVRLIIRNKLPETILTQMIEWICHVAMMSTDNT